MKNLTASIYWDNDLKSYLTRGKERDHEMQEWLEKQGLDIALVKEAMSSLLEQREDPAKFPNIILFLDANNRAISIDEALS